MWIDDACGDLVDWTTQRWVQATGRRVSLGECFGSPGFYFTVHGRNAIWAQYRRGLRETIHVYGSSGDVRADHVLTLFGATFLELHYRLRHRTANRAADPGAAINMDTAVT